MLLRISTPATCEFALYVGGTRNCTSGSVLCTFTWSENNILRCTRYTHRKTCLMVLKHYAKFQLAPWGVRSRAKSLKFLRSRLRCGWWFDNNGVGTAMKKKYRREWRGRTWYYRSSVFLLFLLNCGMYVKWKGHTGKGWGTPACLIIGWGTRTNWHFDSFGPFFFFKKRIECCPISIPRPNLEFSHQEDFFRPLNERQLKLFPGPVTIGIFPKLLFARFLTPHRSRPNFAYNVLVP